MQSVTLCNDAVSLSVCPSRLASITEWKVAETCGIILPHACYWPISGRQAKFYSRSQGAIENSNQCKAGGCLVTYFCFQFHL